MRTQAAYLQAPWRTELREIELPDQPPAGWVRIRVEVCRTCGTDRAYAAAVAES